MSPAVKVGDVWRDRVDEERNHRIRDFKVEALVEQDLHGKPCEAARVRPVGGGRVSVIRLDQFFRHRLIERDGAAVGGQL